MRVVVIDAPKIIRQTEAARAEADAHRIRKPFGEEINSGFASVADVSADVEEFVSGDWFEEPFAETTANSRTHSLQGECDNADEGAPVAQI